VRGRGVTKILKNATRQPAPQKIPQNAKQLHINDKKPMQRPLIFKKWVIRSKNQQLPKIGKDIKKGKSNELWNLQGNKNNIPSG
jgi:hypothetical protein